MILTTFYPPYHIGGDGVHAYQLTNELSKIGHEVHVIHLLDSYLIKRNEPRNGVYPNGSRVTIHAIKSPYGIFSLLNACILGKSFFIEKNIRNIIADVDPDIIHHHNVAGFGPGVFKYNATNVLYTAHDYWSICPIGTMSKPDGNFCYNKHFCTYCTIKAKRPLQLWRYADLVRKNISNVNTIISPSEFIKKALEQNGLKQRIVCIPNFVPFPQYVADKPVYPFDYFLFVGSLEQHKGILELIDIYININSTSKLLVVGTGSLEAAIAKKILINNCSDRIILLGDVEDSVLNNLYAYAQALIIPSIWPENNPLVALEAIASGTPIIVSDQGGLPEIASKMDSSLIFQKNDLDSLKRVLENFKKNAYDCNTIKDISHRYYSKENYIKKYMSLLS